MSIDLFLHIVQAAVIAVSNDGLTALLEFIQIVDDLTAKEGAAILQHQLIEDDR